MKQSTVRRCIAALALMSACSDPPGPEDGPGLPESAALVSASVSHPSIVRGASVVAGYSYVSMLPGTDSLGQRVEITNLRSGAAVDATMLDGGFDPVAIEAESRDSLRITVFRSDGSDSTAYGVVPPKSRPKVVRTSPPNRRTDIPLNSVIVVVFNQPMDSASLALAMRLRLGGSEFAGTVSNQGTGGSIVTARFTPTAPLRPLATYEFAVTPAARSLDGEALEQEQLIQFTTASTGGLGTLVLEITTNGLKPDSNGYLFGIDAAPTRPIANNARTTLTGLRAGTVEVRLDGFDSVCGVAPSDRLTVTIPDGGMATAAFTVNCSFMLAGRIMFASDRSAGNASSGLHWWSIDPDGRYPYMHEELTAYDGELAYTSNGSMAWTQGGNVWFYNWDCCQSQLSSGGGARSPSLSSDGWKVVYSQRVGTTAVQDLMVVDGSLTPQGTVVGSTAPDRITRRYSPRWSRDGQALLFGTDSSINSIRIDGTGELVLLKTSGPVTWLDWSWQTHRLAFNAPAAGDSSQPGTSGSGLYVATEGGQGVLQFMSATAGIAFNTPRWSPTGDRVLYSRDSAGVSSLWVAEPDGSQPVKLTGEGTTNIKPVWIKTYPLAGVRGATAGPPGRPPR